MIDLWTYLKSVTKPIYLYGMGNGADKIIDRLTALDISVSGVFVSDGFVRPKLFHGMPLESYADARKKHGDIIVLTAFGSSIPEVMSNIKRISDECELYAPDLPVVGTGTFDKKFYTENLDKLKLVREHLADEQSLKVFDNVLEYKLTGNIRPLCNCETHIDEAYDNILKLDDNEVFVDLGAYRGDTVTEFLSRTRSYDKIYAVEPDAKTYKKLVSNVPSDVICLNVAISSDKGEECFDMKSGRSSRLSDIGTVVKTDSVDSILNGQRATYIKIDVEGAELQAISGMNQTLLEYKPKLNIAAYHRVGDIFDIPLQVLSVRNDYKVYLRHNPYIPAWDLNYYFL